MGMDSVELMMAWEEHFDIAISNELAATLETPRKVIDAFEEILETGTTRKRWTRFEIERDVCKIIVEQLGISRDSFTLDSSFIQDMGLD